MTVKRVVDLVLSTIGLLIFSPLILLLSIWIKIDSSGPVFYRQLRIGRFGTPFRIYKFRTMIAHAELEGPQVTTRDDSRITHAGKLLRKYKLDELPQLWNVLIGEMSLVGPRPEVPKYINIFREKYEDILKIKPGITDYAAIEFRDEEGILKQYADPEAGYIREILPRKIELYKRYCLEQSLKTDMKIIVLTLKKILFP